MKRYFFCFLAIGLLLQSAQPILAQNRAVTAPKIAKSPGVINIGSHRELFVDNFLIDRLTGDARQVLHHPEPREIVMDHNDPWEGSAAGYHSIFQDGDIYKMYYRAWHIGFKDGKITTDSKPMSVCYAESKDGIHWVKPNLGLHEYNGSKANNIVMVGVKLGETEIDPSHCAIFKDDNPQAAPDARYKAFLRTTNPSGLMPYKSADGIHWVPMTDKPVITDGAFDSQNLGFWDSEKKVYRAYWRYFTDKSDPPYVRVRCVRTATSTDFIHWKEFKNLEYTDSPLEELYTNQIKPYNRAPHLLIGFPARYNDRGWSESMRALPELAHRELRSANSGRYGTGLTEGLLMISRDGQLFKRWNEAFMRPGPERPGTWNYGQQFIGWHLTETKSDLEAAANELSMYAVESYWTDSSSILRRYTLRLDGFVSVNAPMKGGEIITKPVIFKGDRLSINFSSSIAGSIRVEIQDEKGKAIPGFMLKDCPDVFGDTPERFITWAGGQRVSALQGKPVRLRFVINDADLYSFQFQ